MKQAWWIDGPSEKTVREEERREEERARTNSHVVRKEKKNNSLIKDSKKVGVAQSMPTTT